MDRLLFLNLMAVWNRYQMATLDFRRQNFMTVRGILVIVLRLVFLFSFLLFTWHFYLSVSPIYKMHIINPHCCEAYQKLYRNKLPSSCMLWLDFIFFPVLALHILLLLHGSFGCCFRREVNVLRCVFVWEKTVMAVVSGNQVN